MKNADAIKFSKTIKIDKIAYIAKDEGTSNKFYNKINVCDPDQNDDDNKNFINIYIENVCCTCKLQNDIHFALKNLE